MKYLIRFSVILSIFVLASHSTSSFVRSPTNNSTGAPIAWNLTNPDTPIVSGGRIVYSLNPAGSDNLQFSQVEQSIAASFQVWEDIPTSLISFTRGPNNSSTVTTNDGVMQIFWLENSTTTADGLNLAGALGVTRLTTYSGGSRSGEILDASLVLNGNQYTWAVDGREDAVDVREVATHEIGHVIGLSHSPIGGATMFPRSGPGRTQARTLEPDDQIAASVAYPAPGFLTSTGSVSGRVRDNSGAAIFGAHVVAVNSSGVVVTGALSQPDGGYVIQGLPPGAYTVYAEPLDPISGAYYSKFDLQGFYNSVNGDFQTSGDLAVSVGAGGSSPLDIQVTRGNPALDAYYVTDASGQFFRNVNATLSQGQSNVFVGVTGPGLPQSGSPLSISGPGITINRTSFGTTNSGSPVVVANINIAANAPPGSRNIIINNGSQRTIVTGGLEIIGTNQPGPTVAVVSSANFAASVAAESIVAAFGQNLATTTANSTGGTPPTSLGGTSVRLRDSLGNERLAPLFFVSPGQINYQIAPGIQIGQTTVTVTSGSGAISTGSILVNPVAPGLYSADSTGKGLAAAVILRVRSNGSQSFEQMVRFDAATRQYVAIPIDLGASTDQVFLVLFGTGIRFRSALPSVNIGGVNSQVTYAGPQGTLTGLDQVNVRLDRSLIGRQTVTVSMIVDNRASNSLNAVIR